MPAVCLDRAGLTIDKRRFYLLAGQIHYFRYPRAEWRDLLLKAHAGGLNTIDTVIPWNLHEPAEGQFNFAAEADLAGYLDLCAELGLYAIVRPGPYICAEWENGGFPAWLTAKPGLELRVDNPTYLEHTLRWFDTLFPLLAERQIDRGGPIILCQIENEHWASGRYGHDEHQQTLARAAIERGIQVPQYTCMGAAPGWPEFRNGWSGIAEKLTQTRAAWPDNPMIVSELWSGWFDNWGASRHNHKTAARLDQVLHQLTAVGASGLSHWMWAGGTNFGMWGGRTVGGDTIHMTTSYDYDAPISEYGGLTEKFFVARRHHLFLGSFGAQLSAVLADAVPGGAKVIPPAAVAGRGEAGATPYRNLSAGSGAPPAWADFTATFLHNSSLEGQTYQVFVSKPALRLSVEVEAESIKPIYTNLPLDDSGWKIDFHTTRILGCWRHADGEVLVCYGSEGEAGEIQLSRPDAELDAAHVSVSSTNARFTIHHAQFHLRFWIANRPTVIHARASERTLTLVLLTRARAERWWPLGAGGFVCGPDVVLGGGPADEQGQIGAQIERRGVLPFYRISLDGTIDQLALPPDEQPPADSPVIWNSADAGSQALPSAGQPAPLAWTRHRVVERSADEGWLACERPLASELLGCYLDYSWYRAELELQHDQDDVLVVPWLADRARVLVDDHDAGWLGVDPDGPRMTLPLKLTAGRHDLRLLLDNLGRFNYGSNTGERKGLLDTLYWGGLQHDLTGGWVALWQEASFAGEAIAAARPRSVRPDAVDINLGNFAFQGPSVWLLREFECQAGQRYVLHITGDRNPGALFVNGINLSRFSRHYGGGYIKQDITEHVRPGANVVTLNIHGYAGAPWRMTLLEYDPARAVQARWSFRAGVRPGSEIEASDLVTSTGQSPVSGHRLLDTGMAFHRATFAYDPLIHGNGPFKLALPGLRKGQIWLNSHDLGRYWQIGPQEYYKLPTSWLLARNELLIYDEEGGTPTTAWIEVDRPGSDRRIEIVLR